MQKGITITVFVSGMVSLAVEMAASRLLGNYFGASNLIWATIIGLILIYLTAGYFLGGAWADRSPKASTFYQILLWAGLAIGLIPLVSRPILRAAANAFDQLQLGGMIGAFLVVLILFSIPVTLLGTASPFAIRLSLQDSRQAGSVSGRLYAISTLGSFIGTFLPGLVLIPLIGTYRTFLTFSLILLLTALVGLWSVAGWRRAAWYLWMPVGIAILAIIGLSGTDKTSQGMVYE
ncbi:spermine synthase, partial [bacterium]